MRFKFSLLRYWVVLIIVAILFLGKMFLADFYNTLWIFVIFGLAGMVGEALFSVWWYYFFGQRFWVYNEATIYHKYTSFLNFIPWAVGGFMYFYITHRVVGDMHLSFIGLEAIMAIVFCLAIILQVMIFKLFFKNHKFHKLNNVNLLLFYFPIFFTLIILWQIYGDQILLLALYFGFIATIAEYLFGKAIQSLLTKKLWTYTYMTVDKGHFTPLSIPLFSIAGFYFWIIARMII